jgi:hypothetical protein
VTRRRGPSPGLGPGPRGSSEWGTHPCEGTGGFPVAGSRRAWAGPEEEALRVRAGIWRPRLVTVELTRDPANLSSGPPRRAAVPACPGPAPMGDAPGWRPGARAASRVPSVVELATHIRVSHRLGLAGFQMEVMAAQLRAGPLSVGPRSCQ